MRVALLSMSLVSLIALACLGGGAAEPTPDPTPTPALEQTAAPTATPPPETPTEALALTNAPSYQEIPTYDGTGQAVHPDVVYFPEGWQGHAYWLAMTPYPFDTAQRENPSVLTSGDGASWVVPPGLSNPLVPAPPCDHNSDPDLVYNPRADELYLYYTEVRRSSLCGAATNENYVQLLSSSDGVNWSGPQTVMTFDLDTTPLYLSPSVVYRNGAFEMWLASNENDLFSATSDDGITWSPLQPASIDEPLWHVDVRYVESEAEYWMLFVDSPGPGANLKLATSPDGRDWSACPAPLLTPSSGWDNERIYRASFLYEEGSDTLRVWYSARSEAAEWRIGYTEGSHAAPGSSACGDPPGSSSRR